MLKEQWEYDSRTFGVNHHHQAEQVHQETMAYLHEAGEAGWELVSVVVVGASCSFWLKRRKIRNDREEKRPDLIEAFQVCRQKHRAPDGGWCPVCRRLALGHAFTAEEVDAIVSGSYIVPVT